jgi:hypothetical protein
MRKLLLATTALVGGIAISGAAQAAAPTAPITLNVGGYVDFVAGFDEQGSEDANHAYALTGNSYAHGSGHEFETEFKLNFDAMGKAANGIEYGANVSLWNGAEVTNGDGFSGAGDTPFAGGDNGVTVNSAFVWLSGGFGKVLMGDVHGATDLFVYAPTVGEGQIDGRYMDFQDPRVLARFQPSGIDNTEHSTNITYYTPKVGNDNNKVQAGVTYEPNMYDYGQSVVKYENGGPNESFDQYSPYQDVIKGAVQYTGNFRPVNVVASAQVIQGFSTNVAMGNTALGQGQTGFVTNGVGVDEARDFTAWGVGGQVGFAGFTLGGSYVNMGQYMTVDRQDHEQYVYTVGGKYEMDKWAFALNWLDGQGYDNMLVGSTGTGGANTINNNFIPEFNAYGAGTSYTWFPGLTTNLDAVMFDQKDRGLAQSATPTNAVDGGYVILVSQKMTF